MGNYSKFIVAICAAVLIGLNSFFGIDIAIGAEGLGNIVISVLGAIGVYQLPNDTA